MIRAENILQATHSVGLHTSLHHAAIVNISDRFFIRISSTYTKSVLCKNYWNLIELFAVLALQTKSHTSEMN
jgi:hypothetical protein